MLEIYLIFGVFVITILLGMPIAFSVGLASISALLLQGTPFMEIGRNIYSAINSFTLIAIPLFVFAGDVMLKGKITKMLLDVADLIVGKMRGGLGHINIVASMFFAGITGMATADTTAIGSVIIPAMVEKGYERDYSTAITIASSVVGPIIPPSLVFVIYALTIPDVTIGEMFIAGALPGLFIGVGLMFFHSMISKRRNYERRTYKISFSSALKAIKDSFLALLLPLIIIVGILGGIFTITEAAAIAAFYAVIICLFIFKSIKLNELPEIMFNSIKLSSMLVFLLGTSQAFSWVLTTHNVPRLLGNLISQYIDSPYVFLIFANVVLLLIGCVLDNYPAILIFAPIFSPIAMGYGIDPLHFGLIMCVNLLIGMNTPPVGSGLFLGVAVGKTSFEDLVKAVLPFNLIQFIMLILITYVPFFTLWLPKVFGF